MLIVTHTDFPAQLPKTILEKVWGRDLRPTLYKGSRGDHEGCQGWEGMVWELTFEMCRDEWSPGGGRWQVGISASENRWTEGWGRCLLFRNFHLNKSINSFPSYLLPKSYIIWTFYIFKEPVVDVCKADWRKSHHGHPLISQVWIIHACFLFSRQETTPCHLLS